MKANIFEYVKIIIYTMFSTLLVMSSYLIVINIHHYKSLSVSTIVSDIDSDYLKFKNNVNLIEEKLQQMQPASIEITSISKIYNNMKKGGVFRLVPNTKLSYKDLYELNDFFMEELINNSWVHSINEIEISEKNNNIMDMLINNSKYLNYVFTSNSLILHDKGLESKIDDNYHMILSNYLMYSDVILNICDELGGVNE